MERLEFPNHCQNGQWASSYDPVVMGKMRADTVNSAQGNLTGLHCDKCKNRGFIAIGRDDGTFFTRECECVPVRRCMRQMERSGLGQSIREKTFENFSTDTPWQKALKEGAQKYAMELSGWLLMGGQSGCGKTHLCTAICARLMEGGRPVVYMPWREYIGRMKSMSLDSKERFSLIDSCKQAQVLYIDDLYKTGRGHDGSDNPTGSDISLAFEIINHRYINRLPTVISTERTPQELVAIDEATGSRIVELCGEHVYSVAKSPEKNYRLRAVVNL